ncbi:hypothetical protein PMAYCL1PPCAC_18589 [Pristionchus mayeri]|uniref:Uncharacterized protein n=1 Tax=Pristionchus mayeri TaxID=1317129 RepID=A0AAN5CPV3_9BILA|nr:hypothetical protein PMAYCL1PPCAC_18589 [Pristionchus mayeri]
MIGLLVQLSADIVKIWSTSSRRLITYSRDDLPNDCHEGDWINIVFDAKGVLRNIHKTENVLETRRDERGKLQVLDVFLVNPRRDTAYSERFGVTIMESGEEGDIWTEHEKTKGHRFLLWLTLSRSQFVIEKQSLERTYPKDGEYSETYRRMMEDAGKLDINMEEKTGDSSFNEEIMIVGYGPASQRFFSSSHSGESYIHECEWRNYGQLKIGDVYFATLRRVKEVDVQFRVIKLIKKVELWEGVQTDVKGKEIGLELNGKIVDRRDSCCALETIPFGLVTYPTDLGIKAIPEDVQIGDYMRVRINRFKTTKPDYPSKWQVTKLKQKLPPPVDKGIWFEGIVTGMSGSRIFISFKHGNAIYHVNSNTGISLALGTIVDICVREQESDSLFEVCDIGRTTRNRRDMRVEQSTDGGRTLFSVICPAKVMEQRDGYFVLETPIIGTAILFYRDCPRNLRVGETWTVKMHVRKEKRDLPSNWIVHEVMKDSHQSIPCEGQSSERRRREVETKSILSSDSLVDSKEDGGWGTVIITGAKEDSWFGSCYLSDTVIIPHRLIHDLQIPERGTFFRVKCSFEGGNLMAYELNPRPITPKDYKIVSHKECGLHVLCYATIESSQSNAFALFNEILGEATLPHKFAHSEMRVGDIIEAVYYRVKNTNNRTHWMVKECKRITGRSDSNRDMTRNNENDDRRMKEVGDGFLADEMKCNGEINSVVDSLSQADQRKKRDRRVLDQMNYFMSLPHINKMFKMKYPEEIKIIESILDKDRIKPLINVLT